MNAPVLRNFFTAISLVGAAILTWLSIIAAPPLWDMIKSKKAVIVVAPLECEIDEYCFMVSNTGNRSAVLTNIYSFNEKEPDVMGIISNSHRNKVIKPTEVIIVNAIIPDGTPTMLPYELHRDADGNNIRKNCKARFQYIQEYAKEEFTEVEFTCFDKSFHSPK